MDVELALTPKMCSKMSEKRGFEVTFQKEKLIVKDTEYRGRGCALKRVLLFHSQ